MAENSDVITEAQKRSYGFYVSYILLFPALDGLYLTRVYTYTYACLDYDTEVVDLLGVKSGFLNVSLKVYPVESPDYLFTVLLVFVLRA